VNINDVLERYIVLCYEFQVLAHDLDSDVNGKVSYSIARGDRHKQFSIDEKTGYIAVAGNLDREMVR
jgi:protocadherin Fat 1/2/3